MSGRLVASVRFPFAPVELRHDTLVISIEPDRDVLRAEEERVNAHGLERVKSTKARRVHVAPASIERSIVCR